MNLGSRASTKVQTTRNRKNRQQPPPGRTVSVPRAEVLCEPCPPLVHLVHHLVVHLAPAADHLDHPVVVALAAVAAVAVVAAVAAVAAVVVDRDVVDLVAVHLEDVGHVANLEEAEETELQVKWYED